MRKTDQKETAPDLCMFVSLVVLSVFWYFQFRSSPLVMGGHLCVLGNRMKVKRNISYIQNQY